MDYLESTEHEQLDRLRRTQPFVDEVLRQVERIVASRTFDRVHRKAKNFLRFVVAKKLLDQGDHVKELTVAMAVFNEPADFDPTENSKVRVAGADLRQRLRDYYATDGRSDLIHIAIPSATYVPEIHDRRLSVAVSLIHNWHPRRVQDHLCATLSDEIAYILNQTGMVSARRVERLESEMPGSMFGLRGSLEICGDRLHVNVSLANLATGQIVIWRSFDESRDNVFKLTRDIVASLLPAFSPGDGDVTASAAVRRRKRA
jgi:TolB-like protein